MLDLEGLAVMKGLDSSIITSNLEVKVKTFNNKKVILKMTSTLEKKYYTSVYDGVKKMKKFIFK